MIWFCLLCCLSGGRPAAGSAETRDLNRIKADLHILDSDLIRLERELNKMNRDSDRLSDEIERLELRRALLEASIKKSELQIQRASERLKLNQEREETLQKKSHTQQQWISGRLRNLYKRGYLGYAQLFLRQSRLTELINAYHYARVLTERDQRALQEYRQTISQLQAVEKALESIRDQAAQAHRQLARQRQMLETVLKERNRRLKEIKRESSKNQRLLEELELEKEELRLMVLRLTESDTDPMELRVPIARYRGKLSWPVQGALLRKFGIYKDPEFKTTRRQNGIRIIAPKGRRVQSIYSGKVIFADWFKGYGNLIIIDHGEKIISFYAHCDRLLVKKGQFVERDALIAFSGDTGSLEGPLLHFEIRNKTVPEDPLIWLARKPAKKTGRGSP